MTTRAFVRDKYLHTRLPLNLRTSEKVFANGRLRDPSSKAAKAAHKIDNARFQKSIEGATHGHDIYVWNHVKTNQVIYSLSRKIHEHNALSQLTFVGKKSVPATIRKDHWLPLVHIQFPSREQGLRAFQELREFRFRHEFDCDVEDIKVSRSNPFFAARRPYDKYKEEDWEDMMQKREGQLAKRKERIQILMNQKANAIADIAKVLDVRTREAKETKHDPEQLELSNKRTRRARDMHNSLIRDEARRIKVLELSWKEMKLRLEKRDEYMIQLRDEVLPKHEALVEELKELDVSGGQTAVELLKDILLKFRDPERYQSLKSSINDAQEHLETLTRDLDPGKHALWKEKDGAFLDPLGMQGSNPTTRPSESGRVDMLGQEIAEAQKKLKSAKSSFNHFLASKTQDISSEDDVPLWQSKAEKDVNFDRWRLTRELLDQSKRQRQILEVENAAIAKISRMADSAKRIRQQVALLNENRKAKGMEELPFSMKAYVNGRVVTEGLSGHDVRQRPASVSSSSNTAKEVPKGSESTGMSRSQVSEETESEDNIKTTAPRETRILLRWANWHDLRLAASWPSSTAHGWLPPLRHGFDDSRYDRLIAQAGFPVGDAVRQIELDRLKQQGYVVPGGEHDDDDKSEMDPVSVSEAGQQADGERARKKGLFEGIRERIGKWNRGD